MTLQQLRYFLAMMETCSVSRAAAICGVTQPTLSVALRRLEEEFGTQLFVPDGRGLRPLPVARRLEAHVRSAVGAIAEARRELAQDRSRPLRIGLLPSLASAWLTGLSKVCDNHAEFTEAAADELERLVAGGRLDLALTAWSGRSGSNRHEVLREPYQLFVGPAHEFAGRRRVRIADLHSQAFVLRECCELLGSGRRLLQAAGVHLKVVARTKQEASAGALVAAAIGITLAPRSWGEPGVKAVEVSDLQLERSVGVVWRAKQTAKVASVMAGKLEAQLRSGLSGRS